MNKGKIILPRDWDAWDADVLIEFNRVFTIDEIRQSPDGLTYEAVGRSPLFSEADNCPLYILMLDEKHKIRFRKFKEEEF